jgi:hypothetical protein
MSAQSSFENAEYGVKHHTSYLDNLAVVVPRDFLIDWPHTGVPRSRHVADILASGRKPPHGSIEPTKANAKRLFDMHSPMAYMSQSAEKSLQTSVAPPSAARCSSRFGHLAGLISLLFADQFSLPFRS